MAVEQRWQSPGRARDTDPMDRFVCPICLEIFENPVRVNCGHIFCSTCLHQCLKQKNPMCGVCRCLLTPGRKAADLERQMEVTEASCKGCSRKMYLAHMRAHAATCSKYENYVMEGIKSVTKEETPQTRQVSDVPNRFTFTCPYCREQNLDQEGLVDHCRKQHFSDPTPVVCPICASMPWGDPTYRSSNFMEHVNRRHRFSYDTFVDYNADEEAMMHEALMRSLMDN
ncbi:E3 ubiquitin-protein ligase RNF114 [Spea bombifrons]|uniref:E3 ubiquitin-protein ligase RNF114 n=1 Tax=Spea bombifrons TaxID=233779 RepID=UPI0023499263|nr:E3 ubiquitin-protein ligase RNF114 [Spea bombifrons]